ncbi:aminopeptidase N [Propionivibrio sp.]|uniref:aminopeptidase N n=1 Tax=Propionivibrio sp. TaxID=2212460 RepID=UPI0026002A49|nr:aminopeptidase N [Propionivibrio sp.]MBK7356989.1 aminopeptidase N [Propionivibrio sp.]MBK8401580.1 aminopeptidase N [Propionivibrio sp.]MBK8745437.1 aminopeptidase N [Propionivibrio sp.]
MHTDTPAPVRLRDYTPPAYLVNAVHLDVDICAPGTWVVATLNCVRNPAVPGEYPLVLDGEELETHSVKVDGRLLPADAYQLSEHRLVVNGLPERFTLETRVSIQPDKNTQLSGLYRSRDGYFTQCEPQGFRRITWFIDRPDVMARYTVTIHADKADFPFLLCNGNPVDAGDEAEGRHYATWEDPFRKPCYLFALVAGKLDVLRSTYRTRSAREVKLSIYVEPGKLDQCGHAMTALKKAMQWDEETFGLECDLDHYMIVAVGDFNMGAMENKGLNIFNTKYVLARADVATDADFENIDRVVAHEYFHNWTGNRVTCRDWFQLSLKEGLTVFRDQEFGADMHSRETARIREVRGLRAAQFPEDAGPMAHPVRPFSYLEINNFYTATVYEKGAEVVRMIRTLIGTEAFRRGMDIYFERHDEQAVTCDDFVVAMGDAAAFDFTPFMTWYSQAGTPKVTSRGDYDAQQRRYALTLTQSCAPTPDQAEKAPYLIPVAVGLVGPTGADLDLGSEATADAKTGSCTRVLHLVEPEQVFVFDDIAVAPVPSLLRNFSAPVVLEHDYSEADLVHLLAHDSDPFNRWEAGQRLFGRLIRVAVIDLARGETVTWPDSVIEAARKVLLGTGDPAFIAETLTLPGEATLAEQMEVVDPEVLHAARTGLARHLASGLENELARIYATLAPIGPYQPDTAGAGRRRLRNLCLGYLNELDSLEYLTLAHRQFDSADNMSDQFAALTVLANAPAERNGPCEPGKAALAAFYARWQDEALVVDKWLSVQASSRVPGTLALVESLTRHPAFDIRNPNKVYALLRTFGANHRHFHAADGSGYRFLAGQIAALDPVNPQVAARMARSFDRWKRFDAEHQSHARAALQSLQQQAALSGDVFEVVSRALAP